MQGGAGGWLPKGFTELEWLESSGTQYIDTGLSPSVEMGCELDLEPSNNPNLWCVAAGVRLRFLPLVTYPSIGYAYSQFDANNLNAGSALYPLSDGTVATSGGEANSSGKAYTMDGRAKVSLNWQNCRKWVYTDQQKTIERELPDIDVGGGTDTIYLFHRNRFEAKLSYWPTPIYAIRITDGTTVIRHFVPVLNADGVPGMYDKVGKQFYRNNGSGTFGYRIKRTGAEAAPMSLRDPWRVAPSGVYARKVGEHELEVLADTEETTGDGWEWFATTAAAYEHFGIVPDMEEELLTE